MHRSLLACLASASFADTLQPMLGAATPPAVFGIRLEFVLFALTLLGVALFHHKTMYVALTGLVVITTYKVLLIDDFHLVEHLHHEWQLLLNLGGLLVGFAILAEFFKDSKIPDVLPAYLPDDWRGGFVLLVLVFVISTFLDNIAAAMIGGAVAAVVFQRKVHLGFLAAIVAASNAGGAGSVVGDTTTTMMWIDHKPAVEVLHAFIAAGVALVCFGVIASHQQDRYQRIQKDPRPGIHVDWTYVLIVGLILAGAIAANIWLEFPAVGVWAAILVGSLLRKPATHEIPPALRGACFLLSLVLCASMMPVQELPPASWPTTLALGFVSAVFDNIPLTKLALDQGGYDWGVLAYAVGFGGSMVWFGSSAGVALSTSYPEAKSVVGWVKAGWHVAVAYVVGFFVLLAVHGWHPRDF